MKKMTTEQRILKVDRSFFAKNGFKATTTRMIAEEAGVNVALINYYFRSKEGLYNQILKDDLKALYDTLVPLAQHQDTSLEDKIRFLVNSYTNVLLENEDLALMVINEIHNGKSFVLKYTDELRGLYGQLNHQLEEFGSDQNPYDLMLNVVALTVYPFIAKPMITITNPEFNNSFKDFVEDRKEKIVALIMNCLRVKTKKENE